MPIVPERTNINNVLTRFRERVLDRTGLVSFGADSKLRALTEVFAQEIYQLREGSVDTFLALQIDSTNDLEHLTKIGEIFGVRPIGETFAEASASERCFAFFTNAANFGTINSGNPILVPAGTILSSNSNENELNTTIDFITTQDVTLGIGESLVFVSARSVASGERGNIDEGVITSHNFTNYTDVGNGSLLCTNLTKVLNGRQSETLERFRARVSRGYTRLISDNATKVQLDMLAIPGVVKTKIIPGYFGMGTAAVVVYGPENIANEQLVEAAQARLNNFNPLGSKNIAISPPIVKFDFELEFKTIRKVNTNEQVKMKVEVRKTIQDFFREISIGGEVDLDQLALRFEQRVSNIIKVDTSGDRQKLFNKTYIRKGYSFGPTEDRQKLIVTSLNLQEEEVAALGNLEIRFI